MNLIKKFIQCSSFFSFLLFVFSLYSLLYSNQMRALCVYNIKCLLCVNIFLFFSLLFPLFKCMRARSTQILLQNIWHFTETMNGVFIHLGQYAWWGELFYVFFFSTVVVVRSRWFTFENTWIQLHKQFSCNQLNVGFERLFWKGTLNRIIWQRSEWNWLKKSWLSRRKIKNSRNRRWILTLFRIKWIHQVKWLSPLFVAAKYRNRN